MPQRTLEQQLEAEHQAWSDFFDRMARNDVDQGFYMPGDPRPQFSWWRRLLRIPPKHLR